MASKATEETPSEVSVGGGIRSTATRTVPSVAESDVSKTAAEKPSTVVAAAGNAAGSGRLAGMEGGTFSDSLFSSQSLFGSPKAKAGEVSFKLSSPSSIFTEPERSSLSKETESVPPAEAGFSSMNSAALDSAQTPAATSLNDEHKPIFTPETDTPETEQDKKNRKPLFVLIMLLALALLGGGGAFVLFRMNKIPLSSPQIQEAPVPGDDQDSRTRENTLILVRRYIEQGLYDQALSLLNGLMIQDPDDEESNSLMMKAAALKKQHEDDLSMHGGAFSQQGGMMWQDGALSQQGGMMQQDGALSQQGDAMQQDGALSQQGGAMQQDGALSQQGGMMRQDGALSQQGGAMQQDGAFPQQGGMMQQDGALSQQGGAMQQNGAAQQGEGASSGAAAGPYTVVVDTSEMAASIDSLRSQLAAQAAENERNIRAMNELMQRQAEAEERRKAEEAEKKAAEAIVRKQQEEAEAKRKMEEAELAAKNAELKKIMEKVNAEIEQAKDKLNSENIAGAIAQFENAKDMLPTGDSEDEKQFNANKLSEISLATYSASQKYNPENAELKNESVEYAKRTLEENPTDVASHYVLGMDAFDKKNYAEAEQQFSRAVQGDSSNFLYYYQLGRAQAYQNKNEAARQSFLTASRYNSEYAPAQYNLGIVYSRLNQQANALSAYRKACEIDSDYENAYLATARILVRQGDVAGGIAAYEKAIAINPANARTYKEEGSAYASQKNYAAAESAYRKALALLAPGEKDPDTYYNLSTVMYSQGKFEDALVYAKTAYDTRDAPGKAVRESALVYNYALLLDGNGKYSEAMKLYREVLALDANHVKAKINLAALCIAENDADTALALLESAISAGSNSFEVNNNLGNAYRLKNDYNNAVTYYVAALKLQPKDVTVRENLAKAYASSGQYDNAKTTYEQVIQADKNNFDAMIELAKVNIQLKDNAGAKEWLSRVQTSKPAYRRGEVESLLSSITN